MLNPPNTLNPRTHVLMDDDERNSSSLFSSLIAGTQQAQSRLIYEVHRFRHEYHDLRARLKQLALRKDIPEHLRNELRELIIDTSVLPHASAPRVTSGGASGVGRPCDAGAHVPLSGHQEK